MRNTAHIWMCVLFLGLMLILSRGLVRGPEPMEVPHHAPSLTETALACPAGPETHETTQSPGDRGFAGEKSLALPLHEGEGCTITTDRNGYPLRSRVWRREVYTVCPPEGVPG